jgi:hypothetical protein
MQNQALSNRQGDPVLERSRLSSDMNALMSLSETTLRSLSKQQPNTSTPANSNLTAVEALDAFSPGSSSPEASQVLSRAYVRAMRDEVLPLEKQGGGGAIAARLDAVRSHGQGVVEAMSEVKA